MTEHEIEELAALAENLGMEPYDLDEDVHDAKSGEASTINNEGGLQGQLEYLVGDLPFQEAKDWVRFRMGKD